MSTNDTLRGLLAECRGIVANEVAKWDRMSALLPVNSKVESGLLKRIDAALAEPAVEAAEIEVVAYTDNSGAIYTSKLLEIMGVDVSQCEPLMTVAQHRRILAGVNQQAGSGWVACADRMPEVKKGSEQEFNIAVRRANGQTYVFSACYLNEMELYSEEEGDEEGLVLVTGWRREMADDEYDTAWHSVICDKGDEVTHWQPLPPSPAAKAGEA